MRPCPRPQATACEARIEFTWPGETRPGYDVNKTADGRYVLEYGQFAVAEEADDYRLTIAQFDA